MPRLPLLLLLLPVAAALSAPAAPRAARGSHLEFRVVEGAKHGAKIGEPLSRTLGRQPKGLRFQFSRMNRYLGLNESSGQLWVKSVIDREALCPYVRTCCPAQSDSERCYIPAQVVLSLGGRPVRILRVDVHVDDINDEPPRFPAPTRLVSLAEDAPVGTAVAVTAAEDRDTPPNAVRAYSLTRCDEDVFNLTYSRVPGSRKAYEVRLVLNRRLDHETQVHYTCRVQATDGVHEEAMDVKLTVRDVNDHAPEWSRREFAVSLRENYPRYKQFFQLHATDRDEDFGEVSYSFGGHAAQLLGPFALNRDTGELSLEEDLNFDASGQAVHRLPVVAADNGRPVPLSVTGTVTVTVLDVNDNAPVISAQAGRVNVEENAPPAYLTFLTVSDRDQGANGRASCALVSYGHLFNLTRIDDGAYAVYSTAPIDREAAQVPASGVLKLGVLCTDAGKPPRSSTEDIMVYVLDVNDHAPRFAQAAYVARLAEDQPGGTAFLTVAASDADAGDNAKLEFSLLADPEVARMVTVEGHSGVVASADRFDRETRDRYEFRVLVRDRGSPPLNDTARVTLMIADVNDNAPRFAPGDRHRFQVLESAAPGSLLGVVNASDADLGENGSVVFGQERGRRDLPFAVRPDGRVELTRRLDRERDADYSLTVTARDRGPVPRVASTTLVVSVLDVNDSPPAFDAAAAAQINVSCDEPEGFHQAFVTASDPDEHSRVRYRLGKQQPGRHRFRIDPATGQLTVAAAPSPCRAASFALVVVAEDAEKPHLHATRRLRVVVRGHARRRQFVRPVGEERAEPPPHPPEPRDELDLNLVIIIILVCTAVVLTFVMLAAALYLRRRQLRAAQEYEKGRREMPDGETLRREKERQAGPPAPMYSASLPSSPRKDFDHLKKSNMSLEDVYHEHDLDCKASRLKLEGSSTKLKPAQYGNDTDDSGVPLNPQISHDSTHTYQSMSTHKESPENAGYTVFQHELFSYIPDTLRSANVDSKKKNKTSQVTISFV